MVDLLESAVMPYAWGSRTAIAELVGRPSPAPGPEAELWMGAHPSAPSRIVRAGTARSLADVVADDPEGALGAASCEAFGPRLPFLLKVLAADEPLSLQAHPHEARAREGFADEERRGVARAAPTRNFKDASHKPELLCALGPFDALTGFRRAEEILALFDALGVRELQAITEPLRARPDARGIAAMFEAIMTAPEDERVAFVRATVAACEARAREGGDHAREMALARKLAELYPGDAGVVAALMLNQLHLEPGEAVYLGAGNLHAYLGGVGVEIMASSDNVLRGGLTKKHVDVPELLRALVFEGGPVAPLRPRAMDAHESVYETPAREFRLSIVRPGGADVAREVRGPEILLATRGSAAIRPAEGAPVDLTRGRAAFVPACTGRYTLSGDGDVFRASVNLPPRAPSA